MSALASLISENLRRNKGTLQDRAGEMVIPGLLGKAFIRVYLVSAVLMGFGMSLRFQKGCPPEDDT